MNNVNLIGNLGADVELRQTQSGKAVCSFDIAVRDFENTHWITIVAWGKTAELVAQYMRKGSKIGVSGRLQVRSWEDQNGNKRKSVEVVAERVDFCDSNPNAQGGGQAAYQNSARPDVYSEDFEEITEGDDSLPF